jgi:hypothetical protein
MNENRTEEAHLDCFVPRAGSENTALRRLEPFDDPHGSVVLRDLLSLTGLNVKETRGIITTAGYNLVSLLLVHVVGKEIKCHN